MMRFLCLALLLLGLTGCGTVRSRCDVGGWHLPHGLSAGLARERIHPNAASSRQDPEVKALTRNILLHGGIEEANFILVQKKGLQNAFAVLLAGQRYLVYDPEYLRDLAEAEGTDWVRLGILAHEIGHHVLGHTLDEGGSKPATELEADAFAARIMARMGASEAEATGYLSLMPAQASNTHPGREARREVMRAALRKTKVSMPRPRTTAGTSTTGPAACPLIDLDQPARVRCIFALHIDQRPVTRICRLHWCYDDVIRGRYLIQQRAMRLLGRNASATTLKLEEYDGCILTGIYQLKKVDEEAWAGSKENRDGSRNVVRLTLQR